MQAAGRNARSTTPLSTGCAPNRAWGLAWARRTSASSWVLAAVVISGGFEQPADPGHGDGYPVRPVVELVLELVDRLLELVDREQVHDRRLAWRQERGVDGAEILLKKDLTRAELEVRRRRLPLQNVDRRGDVRERPQHAGHVTQWRAFLPALRQRPSR